MGISRTVLVTGGAGFIGSHACSALALAGYLPVTLDNLVTGHAKSVKWGPLERGSIEDRDLLDRTIAEYRPGAIMHFAAHAYVGESVIDPAKYYRNNVAGTLTLLEAAVAHGVPRFVFSSSCATYGIPADETVAVSEETPQVPISPYGASKLMSERIISDIGAAKGVTFVNLRYFNAAGAHPTAGIGESHDPETHLIPLTLEVAAGRRESLKVFGGDYPTKDGTCVRDYIHVCDLADAHVLSLGYLEGGGGSRAFNLGNEQGFSVLEIINSASRVTGVEIQHEMLDRRSGDPAALFANATAAQRELHWKPRYPQIDRIIEDAWRWTRERQY